MTAEGVVTYIGPQVARYGFGQGDFVGEDFRKFVLPGDRDYMTEELQRFVATGEALLSEFRFRAADGQIRWLQAHGTLYRDPAGRAVATSGLLREITERKELEWTLAELSAQERRRFGQDLHDGLGQELTGLACLAACLQKSVRTKGSPSPEIVDKLADRIQHAIDSMRRIAKGLLPVEIDELGLVVALEQLAEGWTHSCRIPCYFRCPEPVVVEDNTIATELFRIAQEALNNAAKHSQAHQVELELAKLADSISLTVRDDGVGLPDTLSHVAGMGLRIMRYRAGLIGATLHIRSCSGAGTEILCTVPTGHNPLSPS
jgi:PAS domain S-box-containing protein